ncbi:MAG: FAD-dependent oxidoreductase [Alphaproteobacteria bacterium]
MSVSKPKVYDLCILGAGSGGLVVASVAAQLGYSVALLEGGHMGGDCLNSGCVPSKALIAAAKMAYNAQKAAPFGVELTAKVNFAQVMAHVQQVVASIAPHDSAERFTSLGCDVISEYGTFADDRTVVTPNGQRITARRFVVATGSRASIPPIAGLAEVPYLTNETIWQLKELPSHLAIIGGGPIGIEMAQSFRRLGSQVTVLEGASRILPHDDAELVALLSQQLTTEGITLQTDVKISKISKQKQGIGIEHGGETLAVSHLLVAAGRTPNVENLGLEKAGIAYTKTGITVNDQLQTTNKRVYAVGDVAGPYRFTHTAGAQAGVFIQRVLFGNMFAKSQTLTTTYNVPWVTYTDPELAHVGLNLPQAQARFGMGVRVTEVNVGGIDRYVAERNTLGKLKVITAPNGRVVGATMLGALAGEMLPMWGLMIEQKLKLSALSRIIHAYPTHAEVNKRIVSAYYAPALYAPRTQWLSRLLFRLLG